MRFVEDEDELRLVEVADLGKVLEQLGEQPEQERRVETRLQDQLIGRENADDAASVEVRSHEVGEIERGLTEEVGSAFAIERQQRALNHSDRLRAHEAVLRRDVLRILGDERQKGAQVVEIEKQKAAFVGETE